MDKKKIGSYYTPLQLSSFISNYCLSYLKKNSSIISILEPSVGDGSFIEGIVNSLVVKDFNKINISVVEKEKLELEKLNKIRLCDNISLKSFNKDYLEFHFENKAKYSLIIGNPPYVKKNHLTEEQKELASRIHREKELDDKSINNIWTAFVVSSISKLKSSGCLAMVLPLEILQVKFTEEIRELLKNEFERLEIFTFEELQFLECKGQDTVLIIGYKKHKDKGVFYTNIDTLENLELGKYTFYKNVALSSSNRKWTHHFITPEEYNFLDKIKKKINNIEYYVNNKAGIVTAANDYFIVKNEVVNQYGLKQYTKPILQKGYFVTDSVVFTNDDFKKLAEENRPSFLLDFNNLKEKNITPFIREYLNGGVEKKINERFKCRQRKRWYDVPNISIPSDAFFFKRAHQYPKLLENRAEVYVTDSAYKVEMKDGYNIQDFIFSFYNSLTLLFSELEGRYYGGGVLELTPNEFRVLPLPYVKCENFDIYIKKFKNKESIEELLREYNYYILNTTLGLTQEEIEIIEKIRVKLVNRRLKKK